MTRKLKSFSVFTRKFLRWRAERDEEPRSAAEADAAGPWQILPLADGRLGLFRQGESPAAGDPPEAVFWSAEDASLTAAILPATGRDPLYLLQSEATAEGFPSESGGEIVGYLRLFNPDVTAYLHAAACIQRSPDSYARFLAAGSGLLLARADRIFTARELAEEET
jgi:hypothetical protein